MFRKDLIALLFNNPMRVVDVARQFKASPKDVEQDLRHLMITLKKSDYCLKVYPATCRKCDFLFSSEKLTKPGKCPQCKGTWIEEPLVEVVSP
jgi:predicted Zn-ribbon and HTH transcriptional regulator